MKFIKWYGWRKDSLDRRDYLFTPKVFVEKLPDKVDLRSCCSPIYNQGSLGSCTANAIAEAVRFEARKQCQPDIMYSRLFIYYNERAMEGTICTDSGAEIRDGMKSVAVRGVCAESSWKYDITKFTQKPPVTCYKEALKHQTLEYQRINSLVEMKRCLASGYPFVFGFAVYAGFESKLVERTGIVQMPKEDEELLGGHAVLAVGYDNIRKRMLCRNSWGSDWGIHGYFWLPFNYISDPELASDFWTIRKVE